MEEMRWAEHIVRTGGRVVHTGFWWGNLRERDHMKYLYVGGEIVLKWVLKE
jgi:hypothetical protein